MENEQTTSAETPRESKSIFTNKTLIVVAIVGLVAIGWYLSSRFATESIVERAIEQSSGGDVDVDLNTRGEGTVKVKSEDGTEVEYSAGGAVELPASWPTDMPIVAGANITYAGTMNPQTGEASAMVTFISDKSVKEVSDHYTDTLSQEGWTVGATMNTGEMTVLTVTKGEREAGIYITGGADGTSVSISISGE